MEESFKEEPQEPLDSSEYLRFLFFTEETETNSRNLISILLMRGGLICPVFSRADLL